MKYLESFDKAKFLPYGVHLILSPYLEWLHRKTLDLMEATVKAECRTNRIRLGFGHEMYYKDVRAEMQRLQEVKDHQIFIFTMSVSVVDAMYFESVEDVNRLIFMRKKDVLENLNDRDANSFFRAYNTKIQHVSEILESKGYW